jgi:hypothetical protein
MGFIMDLAVRVRPHPSHIGLGFTLYWFLGEVLRLIRTLVLVFTFSWLTA